MATQTLHAPGALGAPFARLGAAFAALAQAVALGSGAQARFDRIRALQALSDVELADRGIARDDIVRHVFADVIHD